MSIILSTTGSTVAHIEHVDSNTTHRRQILLAMSGSGLAGIFKEYHV
jgi:hypothetical protein